SPDRVLRHAGFPAGAVGCEPAPPRGSWLDHEAARRGRPWRPAGPRRIHVPRRGPIEPTRRGRRADLRIRPEFVTAARRSATHDPAPDPTARPGRPPLG